jgi:hypothetical protein
MFEFGKHSLSQSFGLGEPELDRPHDELVPTAELRQLRISDLIVGPVS